MHRASYESQPKSKRRGHQTLTTRLRDRCAAWTSEDENGPSPGSLRGADRAAVVLTMITTCRLNDVDPKARLADVLAPIADLSTSRLHELLPWEWSSLRQPAAIGNQKAA